jgi:hypothetical protein
MTQIEQNRISMPTTHSQIGVPSASTRTGTDCLTEACPIILGFLESAIGFQTIPQTDRFWALLPRLSHSQSRNRKTRHARAEIFAWRALTGPIAQTLIDDGLVRQGRKPVQLREFEWLSAAQWIGGALHRYQGSTSKISGSAHQAIQYALTIMGELESNPVHVARIAGGAVVASGEWDLLFVRVEDALKV